MDCMWSNLVLPCLLKGYNISLTITLLSGSEHRCCFSISDSTFNAYYQMRAYPCFYCCCWLYKPKVTRDNLCGEGAGLSPGLWSWVTHTHACNLSVWQRLGGKGLVAKARKTRKTTLYPLQKCVVIMHLSLQLHQCLFAFRVILVLMEMFLLLLGTLSSPVCVG